VVGAVAEEHAADHDAHAGLPVPQRRAGRGGGAPARGRRGIVIATSGGSDWLWPTTTAVPTDGGFLVTGRKAFCSQSPEATVVATSAVLGDPGGDAQVLHFSVPFAASGVSIEETWDTLGMRGTASHDVVMTDVFVPADKIAGRRPYGEFGVPLMAAALH
jgi:alkylation response protein AidB-like acyl-CoA dehydrogenase